MALADPSWYILLVPLRAVLLWPPLGGLFFCGEDMARPLYYAGFIDAGFLKAAGRTALGLGTAAPIDARRVVEWLRGLPNNGTCLSPGHTFLRAYWYDGAHDPGRADYQRQRPYLEAVAATPGIQARWGHLQLKRQRWQVAVKSAVQACGVPLPMFEQHFTFRSEFEQKGVDTRIVLDLVRLADNGAYDIAILVTGDRDIAEAVRVAQDRGCRVLLAHPPQAGVAHELRDLADEIVEIDLHHLAYLFGEVETIAPPARPQQP